jgi:hypothetical protein
MTRFEDFRKYPSDRRDGLSTESVNDLAPHLLGWRGYFGFCQTRVCSPTWRHGSAEDYIRISGGMAQRP